MIWLVSKVYIGKLQLSSFNVIFVSIFESVKLLFEFEIIENFCVIKDSSFLWGDSTRKANASSKKKPKMFLVLVFLMLLTIGNKYSSRSIIGLSGVFRLVNEKVYR